MTNQSLEGKGNAQDSSRFDSMTNPVANSISISRECPACVLVNSTAGGGRAKAYLPRIQKLFTDLRFPAEFVLTGSAEELAAKVQQSNYQPL
jgi:hypothetical protein